MKLELLRTWKSHEHTIGILREYITDVEICRTIERAWLDNEPNVSCIPKGEYDVVPDDTGKFQYFKVLGVPDRTLIEFHPANRAKDLMGCIACGDAVMKDVMNNEYLVLHSRHTMNKLKQAYPDGFRLIISEVN